MASSSFSSRAAAVASLPVRAPTPPTVERPGASGATKGPSHSRSLSLSLLHSSLPKLPDGVHGLGMPPGQSLGCQLPALNVSSRVLVVEKVYPSGFCSLLQGFQKLGEVRAAFQSHNDINSRTSRFIFLFFTIDQTRSCLNELHHSATLLSAIDLAELLHTEYFKAHNSVGRLGSVSDLSSSDKLVFDGSLGLRSGVTNFMNQGVIEIFGMPESIDIDVISQLCAKFGPVHHINCRNPSWVVEFVDTRAAEKALESLNGLRFGNYMLEVCIFHQSVYQTASLSKIQESIHDNMLGISHEQARRFPALSVQTSPLRKFASTGNLNDQLGRSKYQARLFTDSKSPLTSAVSAPIRTNCAGGLDDTASWESTTYTLENGGSDNNFWASGVDAPKHSSAGIIGSGFRRASSNEALRSQTHFSNSAVNLARGASQLHRMKSTSSLRESSYPYGQPQEQYTPVYSQRVAINPVINTRGLSRSGSSDSLGHSRQSNDINIFDIASGIDKRTTFMIRNIPNKFTQQMLIDFVNETHYGEYDFIYLRIDFVNQCNVGYSFINFVRPEAVISFAARVVGMKWGMFNSEKVCMLSYANIQGKAALINKFRNSSVMLEDPSWRPKIFYTSGPKRGLEEEFPVQDLSVRPRSNVLFSRENAWVPRSKSGDSSESSRSSLDSPHAPLLPASAFQSVFINDAPRANIHGFARFAKPKSRRESKTEDEDGLDGDTLHHFTHSRSHSRQLSDDEGDAILEEAEIDVAVKTVEFDAKSLFKKRLLKVEDDEDDNITAVTEEVGNALTSLKL